MAKCRVINTKFHEWFDSISYKKKKPKHVKDKLRKISRYSVHER